MNMTFRLTATRVSERKRWREENQEVKRKRKWNPWKPKGSRLFLLEFWNDGRRPRTKSKKEREREREREQVIKKMVELKVNEVCCFIWLGFLSLPSSWHYNNHNYVTLPVLPFLHSEWESSAENRHAEKRRWEKKSRLSSQYLWHKSIRKNQGRDREKKWIFCKSYTLILSIPIHIYTSPCRD